MKKYSTAPAQGFTLVELIVVIVILAILATIAFLSFGSQSAAARDSKRKTDLSNIASKMNIAMANGTTVLNLVGATGSEVNGTNAKIAGTWVIAGTDYKAWTINFNVLGVNAADFKDADGSNTYKIGATSNAGSAFQLAATLENDNAGNPGKNPFLVGNYSRRTISLTSGNVTYATWATTISVATGQVWMFKKWDYITVNSVANTVTNVSSDLATITLGTATTAPWTSVALALAADEMGWLVASGWVAWPDAVVANGSYLPY